MITTDEDKEDAQRRHLVPIDPNEVARLADMNRHDRRAWAAQQRSLQRQAAKKKVGKA